MRKLFFTVLFAAVLMTSTVRAQDAFDIQMKVYAAGVKYYDLQVAATAIYTAMALKPERKDLRDSLAALYFAGERFGQAYILGEEILKDNPKRKDMMEMVAVSKQSLGMGKEALADYETLYKDSKQIVYLYQIATLQYELKRYGECIASLDQILADATAAKQMVTIRNGNTSSQSVPMQAAALNVKGIVALDLNQQSNAKELFSEAIKVFPDFALAKGNLALLEKNNANTTGTAVAKTPASAPKPTPAPKASGK